MCGRYTLLAPENAVARLFPLPESPAFSPRANIAPGQQILVVGEAGPAFRRWGLIPSWRQDAPSGGGHINARSETAPQKPSFRDAFRARRCLIPADGFYEWQKRPGRPAWPWHFAWPDRRVFAFAGLWEEGGANPPGGSCAILTVEASADLRPVHHRMPAILAPERFAAWLGGDASAAAGLLGPLPEKSLAGHPVSARVGDVREDDAGLVAPLTPGAEGTGVSASGVASAPGARQMRLL